MIHIKHLYPVRTTKEFERDLDFLLKHYNALDIREILDNIEKGHATGKKGFILSFDDGLREFSEIIAPLLIRKGIPAICFLNSGFIDNKDLFFRFKASILIERFRKGNIADGLLKKSIAWAAKRKITFDDDARFLLSVEYSNKFLLDELAAILGIDFKEYLKLNQPYLNSGQVTDLIKKGFSFGAHSIDHPWYSALQPDQQLDQTLGSMNDIANNFGLQYRLFSFPFTDHGMTKQFFDFIFEKKQGMVDLSFGCAGLKKDACIRNIQRIPMEIDSFTASDILYGEYFYYLLKAFFNRNTIRRN